MLKMINAKKNKQKKILEIIKQQIFRVNKKPTIELNAKPDGPKKQRQDCHIKQKEKPPICFNRDILNTQHKENNGKNRKKKAAYIENNSNKLSLGCSKNVRKK